MGFVGGLDLRGGGRLRSGAKSARCRRVVVVSEQVPVGVGEVLQGRYELVEEIGQGSTSVTFSGKDLEDRNAKEGVVVKAMSLKGLKSWKALELFERESGTLASITHPGIPKYLDSFQVDSDDDRMFFLVQARAPGRNLTEMVKSNWRASPEQVEQLLRQLLGVLDYLSSLSPPVIHRDIKPSNIIVDTVFNKLRVSLVDFGGVVAGVREAGDRLGSTMIGTFGYMAPEQFAGAASTKTDLYGVGATLVYVMTHREPGELPTSRLRVDFRKFVEERYKSTPKLEIVLDVVDRLTEPAPEDRFQNAQEALMYLDGRTKSLPQKQQGWIRPPGWIQPWENKSAPPVIRDTPPKGSKLTMEKDEKRLVITVPSSGFTPQTVTTGAFALTWNGFVATFTVGALTAGTLPIALFSVPFWIVGGQLLSKAAKGITEETIICSDKVTKRLFIISRALGREAMQMLELKEIEDVRMVISSYLNGTPTYALEVVEGTKNFRLGEGMNQADLLFVQSQISSFTGKGRPGVLPLPDQNEIASSRASSEEFDRW